MAPSFAHRTTISEGLTGSAGATRWLDEREIAILQFEITVN
jgi:hypothetical protein